MMRKPFRKKAKETNLGIAAAMLAMGVGAMGNPGFFDQESNLLSADLPPPSKNTDRHGSLLINSPRKKVKMSVNQPGKSAGKLCFVTIGATAAFDSLVQAVLRPDFLQALNDHGYTDLCVQHGKDEARVFGKYRESKEFAKRDHGIRIWGFDFNREGLGQEMRAAQGGSDGEEGVVISHAGAGSILDALRINVPLIVVPNPELLDNHQAELAEQMAKNGYAVYGQLDGLIQALGQSNELRKKQNDWPPDNRKMDPKGKGLPGAGEDELSFVD